jgi:SAM-dependent methyltransferase
VNRAAQRGGPVGEEGPSLYQDRGRAESFGADAARYDRSRPSYPPDLIDAVLGGDPSGIRVLDVGCGTGIAARLMQARGARVLGIEVDERMAAVARARGTPVEVASFEQWRPEGRTFDRVTAAQAWHWVDPVAGARSAAAILEPRGRVCLWWNVAQHLAELGEVVDPIYLRLAPEARAFSVLLGTTARPTPFSAGPAIAALGDSPAFDAPTIEHFAWQRTYSRDEWLDQLPTHSDHARLDPSVLADLLDQVGTAIDSLGGSFEMHYTTALVAAERRS